MKQHSSARYLALPRAFGAVWLLAAGLLLASPLALAATTPSSAFTDNGDGTVSHKTSGLTWKRCLEGESWTGSACSGSANMYTWSQANALSGSTWRLPTIAELLTIVERDGYMPTLNTALFPRPSPSQQWSATTDASYTSAAWYVDFNIGSSYSRDKGYTYPVRLVRGGYPLDASGQYTPTADFADNGDGTVTNAKQGLTWKRCAEGQSWSGSVCTGKANTYTWDQAVALAGNGWRLPSENELLGLVEWSKAGYPAINTAIFADTLAPYTSVTTLWSSSAYADNANMAWKLVFGYGYEYTNGKSVTYSALLVRDVGAVVPTSDADRVFNWAEATYAAFFAPAKAATAQAAGYTYRYYSGTGNLLAVKDNKLWLYGPATQNQVIDGGLLSGWVSLAASAGF